MFPTKLNFRIENGRLTVKDLPPHLHLRGMGYTSQKLAELKHVSIASTNIMLAKIYMDSVKAATGLPEQRSAWVKAKMRSRNGAA
jgi:hypothetical protein